MRWAAGLAIAACLLHQPGAAATEPAIRYVANAGMLVTVDGHDVLVDAPIREGIAPYPTSPPADRLRLETARPPYDAVAAVLITHWHEDHFSPEAVAAHLTANPRAIAISSPEVIGRLRNAAPHLPASRLRAYLPAPGRSVTVTVGGLSIRVLRIRHNPARRLPEQHVGFLIGDRQTVLHVGDADPSPDNFSLLAELPRVDVALLPYWYVLGEESRRFVARSINPRRIVAMHMPPDEAGALGRALGGTSLVVSAPDAAGALRPVTP